MTESPTYDELVQRVKHLEAVCAQLRQNDAAHRISGLRLFDVIKEAPVGIHLYRLTADGCLVLTGGNATADKILGIAHRTLVGQSFETVFPAVAETDLPERYRRICTDGQSWTSEHFAYKDARIAGVFQVYAFRTEPGAMISLFIDITARKRLEALLREKASHYRALFENNYSVMLLIDPETGAIVDANPRACAFYGYDPAAFKNMRIQDINTLSAEQVCGEMALASAQHRNYFNFRHRRADGAVVDVEVFSGPIIVGEKTLLCSIVHDISTRKAAEKEREQLIRKLQKALAEVKTLREFLPICTSCKKIRDDKGYWNQLESYLRENADVVFSHSICPDCARALYPGLDAGKRAKEGGGDETG